MEGTLVPLPGWKETFPPNTDVFVGVNINPEEGLFYRVGEKNGEYYGVPQKQSTRGKDTSNPFWGESGDPGVKEVFRQKINEALAEPYEGNVPLKTRLANYVKESGKNAAKATGRAVLSGASSAGGYAGRALLSGATSLGNAALTGASMIGNAALSNIRGNGEPENAFEPIPEDDELIRQAVALTLQREQALLKQAELERFMSSLDADEKEWVQLWLSEDPEISIERMQTLLEGERLRKRYAEQDAAAYDQGEPVQEPIPEREEEVQQAPDESARTRGRPPQANEREQEAMDEEDEEEMADEAFFDEAEKTERMRYSERNKRICEEFPSKPSSKTSDVRVLRRKFKKDYGNGILKEVTVVVKRMYPTAEDEEEAQA